MAAARSTGYQMNIVPVSQVVGVHQPLQIAVHILPAGPEFFLQQSKVSLQFVFVHFHAKRVNHEGNKSAWLLGIDLGAQSAFRCSGPCWGGWGWSWAVSQGRLPNRPNRPNNHSAAAIRGAGPQQYTPFSKLATTAVSFNSIILFINS